MLLTLNVVYGVNVGPGGDDGFGSLLKLVPGVELGDAANVAQRRGLVDRICRLKNNNIIEFH